jgi:EamA-like transporter family.
MQALFAATFPLGKLALAYASPLALIGIRFILAGLILLGYYYSRRWFGSVQDKHVRIGTNIWLFAMTSVFYVFLSYVPEFWALQYLSSFKTNMLWSSAPFISAIMGYFLLRERITLTQFFGILIGTAGMIPIFMTGDDIPVGEFFAVSLPEFVLTIGIVATVYAWFLIKRLLDKGYSLVFINGITMLMGGIMSMIAGLLWPSTGVPIVTEFLPTLGYSLLLVLISNIVGYGIYGKLLNHHSITFLSFTGFLCPIFGAFYGKFFMHETMHPAFGFAFVLIVTGLYLFYKDELRFKKELSQVL